MPQRLLSVNRKLQKVFATDAEGQRGSVFAQSGAVLKAIKRPPIVWCVCQSLSCPPSSRTRFAFAGFRPCLRLPVQIGVGPVPRPKVHPRRYRFERQRRLPPQPRSDLQFVRIILGPALQIPFLPTQPLEFLRHDPLPLGLGVSRKSCRSTSSRKLFWRRLPRLIT